MSKFGGMKAQRTASGAAVNENSNTTQAASATPARNPGREGKKMVGAYYSPEVSRELHLLAVGQNRTLQSVLGEAIDDVLRKHGKHPFGLS